MTMRWLHGFVACAGAALGACQAQAPTPPAPPRPALRPVAYEVLQASATCGTADTSVRRIAEEGRRKHMLRAGAASRAGPVADHPAMLALRISMGEQPSAGARLAVTGARADAGGRLVVDMLWAPPAPGGVHAAVITRPCVVLRVAGGPYRSVQVLDALGHERAAATLAP